MGAWANAAVFVCLVLTARHTAGLALNRPLGDCLDPPINATDIQFPLFRNLNKAVATAPAIIVSRELDSTVIAPKSLKYHNLLYLWHANCTFQQPGGGLM